jgi:cardiolipin synthase
MPAAPRPEPPAPVLAPDRWITIANGLTAVRLVLIPPLVLSVAADRSLVVFAIFWLAVATDMVDGRVARWRGEASRLGGVLDHTTDALFVSAGLAAYAAQGVVPAPLPVLVLLAFGQYALDSRVLAGRSLRTSWIGRSNGVAYFVLLGVPVVRDALSIGWPPAGLVLVLGWALVATTLVSMADRGIAWSLSRRSPDSPGAGTADRSPR